LIIVSISRAHHNRKQLTFINIEKINDRERIAKQIAKTSDSIFKKYCALKVGKMEKDTLSPSSNF